MKKINWKTVGANVRKVYEGHVVEDVLHRIHSIDKALPRDAVAVILERLYEKFGCYADWLHRRYVLCDRPLGAGCKRRGRLYWCAVEEPWFFSDSPLPGCVELTNGYLCVKKDAAAALAQFDKGDCASALAAMPGRRAEVGEWVLYTSEGQVYECDKSASIYRVRQECRLAQNCGMLWKVSKKAVIAYEIIGSRAYLIWQMPALELLRGIYTAEEKTEYEELF
ncbi:MAG: hypothetical protein ACO2PM_15020 [Pyrobaculum sp.]